MEIRTFGDDTLRQRAQPVGDVDDTVRAECARMVEAMIRAGGIGLAAPQLGIAKRIIVLDVEGEFHVVINPEMVELSGEDEESVEGCLSVPGVNAPIVRKTAVHLAGTDLEGDAVEIRAEGFLARAIQHEMDHLNGVLFVDRLSTARRKSVLKEYRRLQEEET
ncbi:MAG: peptide deformylase [Candidatus Bipolaricaulota bacterium]|nr:MAG: peptide deformylase [Candidatus Bipolaricaulota bacterium]